MRTARKKLWTAGAVNFWSPSVTTGLGSIATLLRSASECPMGAAGFSPMIEAVECELNEAWRELDLTGEATGNRNCIIPMVNLPTSDRALCPGSTGTMH